MPRIGPAVTFKRSNDPWSVYRRIYGELRKNMGGAIREQAGKTKAGMTQSLISRGLYNTTVLDNMRASVDRRSAMDIANLAGDRTSQAMGMVGQMTPPSAIDPSTARRLGYLAGMGGSARGQPEWFSRFGSLNKPQNIRLGR